MKRTDGSLLIGAFLIVVGVLALLQTFGFLTSVADLLWAGIFATGGIGFVLLFLRGPALWWAVIPGFALLGIASLIGISALFPAFAGGWLGGMFLGWLSLSFWVVYAVRREFWWAIIPGGVLATLAVIASLSTLFPAFDAGSIFFLGLALTFGLLYVVPTPQGRMTWPLIPAAVMLVMAVVVMTSTLAVTNIIWPSALILVGLFLLYRAFRPARDDAERKNHEHQTLSQPH